jgi:hypothetical protein
LLLLASSLDSMNNIVRKLHLRWVA